MDHSAVRATAIAQLYEPSRSRPDSLPTTDGYYVLADTTASPLVLASSFHDVVWVLWYGCVPCVKMLALVEDRLCIEMTISQIQKPTLDFGNLWVVISDNLSHLLR